jgi:hypothetical protein
MYANRPGGGSVNIDILCCVPPTCGNGTKQQEPYCDAKATSPTCTRAGSPRRSALWAGLRKFVSHACRRRVTTASRRGGSYVLAEDDTAFVLPILLRTAHAPQVRPPPALGASARTPSPRRRTRGTASPWPTAAAASPSTGCSRAVDSCVLSYPRAPLWTTAARRGAYRQDLPFCIVELTHEPGFHQLPASFFLLAGLARPSWFHRQAPKPNGRFAASAAACRTSAGRPACMARIYSR